MRLKNELRVIGFDDGPFESFKQKNTLLVGVITRGDEHVEGIISTKIEVDGTDVTNKIITLINNTKHKTQLRAILLNGITFAGSNVVDIEEVYKKIKKPVIVIIRREPNFEKFKNALRHTKDYKYKLDLLKKAGDIYKVDIKNKHVYVQFIGIDIKAIENLLKLTTKYSLLPESIRLAHLIASGIVNGESRGRV